MARLKLEDVDNGRMLIHIKDSKGRKDRYTLLSEKALETLRHYWREYKPTKWLFEGAMDERYLSIRTVQATFEQAKERCNSCIV